MKHLPIALLLITNIALHTMDQNLTSTEFHNKYFAIIKATVEDDIDTMMTILDSTPLHKRTFYLNFPEYNFGFDYKPRGSDLWHKVYSNYFSLVNVGKQFGMVDDSWKIEATYYSFAIKSRKDRPFSHAYAIDNPAIKEESD